MEFNYLTNHIYLEFPSSTYNPSNRGKRVQKEENGTAILRGLCSAGLWQIRKEWPPLVYMRYNVCFFSRVCFSLCSGGDHFWTLNSTYYWIERGGQNWPGDKITHTYQSHHIWEGKKRKRWNRHQRDCASKKLRMIWWEFSDCDDVDWFHSELGGKHPLCYFSSRQSSLVLSLRQKSMLSPLVGPHSSFSTPKTKVSSAWAGSLGQKFYKMGTVCSSQSRGDIGIFCKDNLQY